MKRRHVVEEIDPIELAAAVPDEPFDPEPLLTSYGQRVELSERFGTISTTGSTE